MTPLLWIGSLVLSGAVQATQVYPGTTSRPILKESEAATLSRDNYLRGWTPEVPEIPENPDYVVGADGAKYTLVQEAVNAAVLAGGSSRAYILIQPGTYTEIVYVPPESPPLTLYGGGHPSAVHFILNQSAAMNTSDWVNQVNPGGIRYKDGDPAYSMYSGCSGNATLGTFCTALIWAKAANLQLINITVENSARAQNTDHQAVTVTTDADLIQVENLRLLGHQDTFFLGRSSGDAQRVYISNTFVAGDVDFVFGAASAVFNNCTFYVRGDRHNRSGIVFAPDTEPSQSYGFMIENSYITGDEIFSANRGVHLGRAWDHATPQGHYKAGVSPNGQILIRNSRIDAIIDSTAPWTRAASSRRDYVGNNSTKRDLDDNNYNRFWEYNNFGKGV